jgi:AraC-like DNA-binding protein
MRYVKYKPTALLDRYIDFYWVLETGPAFKPIKVPFFADAYTDIFVNLGTSSANLNGAMPFLPGNVYIGGAATGAAFIYTLPDTTFAGIRFKPGGLYVFYKFPLFEIADQAVEFQDKHLYSLIDMDQLLAKRLDEYFISKLSHSHPLLPIAEVVYQHEGQITVDLLAQKCNVSNRTLERLSYTSLGIGPKEFISISRFQRVLKTLQRSPAKGSLMEVAYQMGYYDHAHFTREVKKYSGLTPSAIWPGPKFP